MLGKIKALFIEALIGTVYIIFVVMLFGLIVVGVFWLHGQFLDIFSNNCYTDMFGDVICKFKK